jgi:glutathionyl-hydroquinone reductase
MTNKKATNKLISMINKELENHTQNMLILLTKLPPNNLRHEIDSINESYFTGLKEILNKIENDK